MKEINVDSHNVPATARSKNYQTALATTAASGGGATTPSVVTPTGGAADTAKVAQNIAEDSTDWAKILRKDIDERTENALSIGKNLTVDGQAILNDVVANTGTFGGLLKAAAATITGALSASTVSATTMNANTFIGELQGNAATATKLKTARTIWGQSFDGTGNVDGKFTTRIYNNTDVDYAITLRNIYNNNTSNKYGVGIKFGLSDGNDGAGKYMGIQVINSSTWGYSQSMQFTSYLAGIIATIDGYQANIGIGTTTPQYKLDVNGTLHAAGAVTLSSTLTAVGLITANGGTHTTALTATALSTLAATDILGDAQLSARVMSPDYVSQTTGWGITRAGAADFRNIYADELRVQAFTADISQALAGSDYLTKSVSKLSANFVVPSVNSSVRIIVDDIEGMPATQCFSNNDYIRFRAFNRTSGLTIANVWGTVTLDTTYGTNGYLNGTQAYTFTCKATTGAGLTVFKGSEVLDYGTSGSGLIARTTLDAMGSPYEQIATWVNDPSNGNNYTVHARLGNLNGIANCSGYGLYTDNGFFTGKIVIGDLTKTANYLSFDSVNGLQIKLGGTSVATTTDVTTSVNNIQVGSRNLLKGTRLLAGSSFNGYVAAGSTVIANDYSSFTSVSNSYKSSWYDLLQWSNVITPTPNTYYVLSFYAKSTVEGDKITSYFHPYTQINIGDGATDTTLTTKWAKYVVTWHTKSDISGVKSIVIARLNIGKGTGTVSVCGVKFEEGNKATTWTPAPEDVDANIATAQSTAISTAATNAAALYVTQSAYSSQVSILQNSINAKVSQTDFNALGTRLGTAESNITQNANAITTKVSQTDYTGNTVASLINQTATTIAIQASKINLVGAVTIGAIDKSSVTPSALGAATPTDVNTAVNGIQIGGTNLLRNSAKLPYSGNSNNSWSTGQWRIAGSTSDTDDMKRTSKEITDPPQGDEATVISYTGILRSSVNDLSLVAINSIPIFGNITVSFWARQTSSVDTAFVSAGWSNNTGMVNTNASTEVWGTTLYRKFFLPKDGSWTRFWATFNINNNENLYIGAGNTGTSAEVQICLVKIEKGNKATDWSPAPEDVDASISAAQSTAIGTAATNAAALYVTQTAYNSQVTILQNSINAKVSQTDFNALNTRVGTAESNITQNATAIATKVSQTTFDALGTRVSTAESTITQHTTDIGLRVTKDGVIGAINLTSEAATISASKINLVGAVTISSISSDALNTIQGYSTTAVNNLSNAHGNFTYIDGNSVYTGTLTAGQVNAVAINASSVTTGTLSADRIGANTITFDKLVGTDITALGNVTAGSFNIGSGKFVVDANGNTTTVNMNAVNATISGTLNGVSGTFSYLSAVGSTGTLALGTYGMTFNDYDISQQGNINGRSLRYYAANIRCRGSFGASSINMARVHDTVIDYYVNGDLNSYVRFNLQSNGVGGYYIHLYKTDSVGYSSVYGNAVLEDVYGFPVDLLIFNDSGASIYQYEFVRGNPNKKVTVINANNNFNGTYLNINGATDWQLQGGKVQTFINIRELTNPLISSSVHGAGWMLCGEFDNNWA